MSLRKKIFIATLAIIALLVAVMAQRRQEHGIAAPAPQPAPQPTATPQAPTAATAEEPEEDKEGSTRRPP